MEVVLAARETGAFARGMDDGRPSGWLVHLRTPRGSDSWLPSRMTPVATIEGDTPMAIVPEGDRIAASHALLHEVSARV